MVTAKYFIIDVLSLQNDGNSLGSARKWKQFIQLAEAPTPANFLQFVRVCINLCYQYVEGYLKATV